MSQRDIDTSHIDKWSNRLIDNLSHYDLPYLVANPDRHQQLRLLGKAKWMTLRMHTLNTGKLLKLNPTSSAGRSSKTLVQG